MSNNKQSMKLYTEEQVRKAINDGSLYSYINGDFEFKNSEDDIVNSLIPIELPSDEEIEEYVKSTGYYGHCTQEYHEGIEEGAKYVIDKIQGGNK